MSTSFSNYDAAKLRVKYSDGNQSYTRKTLLKFDLSSAAGDTKEAELVLQLTGGISNSNPAKDFTEARTKDRQPVDRSRRHMEYDSGKNSGKSGRSYYKSEYIR